VSAKPEIYPLPGKDNLDFITVDTDCGRAVRAVDWSATPLGPPGQWSQALRTMTQFVLANRFPQLLWWGPEYVCIYNDAYTPILGSKHPRAMGRPTSEVWSEIWDVLRPLIDTPFGGGPATWMDDIELELERHGFVEECHFTIAYSPVPDETAPRHIGGVLATVVEITSKVIAERRVGILRDLGSRVAEAKTAEDACSSAMNILAQHRKDLPFALLYLLEPDGHTPKLASLAGIEAGDAPGLVANLPLADALETERTLVCSAPAGLATDMVAMVPIKSNMAHHPAGALVVGISPRIRFDAAYSGFLELMGSQIATAIANARAHEEERHRAAALAEIDRAKTAFFSNVSHEFRTPLTLMLGPLRDTLEDPSLPAPLRAQLDVAQRNSLRLLKLVNSLLDFARIEAGRVTASYEPVDLAALTTDLASNFRSAMDRAGLHFEVECPPLAQHVYVDREMWEKIVLNLLSNAFKYTHEGRIDLRLRCEADHVALSVTDTGIGVAAHELPRLFERFHRVEGARGRTQEGSGIGLALVQELVKLHGGSIVAHSDLDRGSTFTVRIPLGSAHLPPEHCRARTDRGATAIGSQAYVEEALHWLPQDTASRQPRPSPSDTGSQRHDPRFAATYGARIVLADDNADMRAYVADLLGPAYRVEAVDNGLAALAAIRRQLPDLVISDIMMPGLDGMELAAAMRKDPALRPVPVILLSARAGEEARNEGLSAGADDYMVKPFTARELLARVGALLELVRTRRDSEERFRAFVQATADVVYRMGPDWSEMRFLHGRNFIADTTLPSTRWIDHYIPQAERERVLAAINDAVLHKKPFELEHRVIRTDGTLGWMFSRAIPLLDRDGSVTEWLGTATDVTEKHRTHEALLAQRRELEDASRQKDEFLAMLAHELRNPLAPIRNAGELLSRKLPADVSMRTAVHTIERQVTHLTRLVDDLLDVSRITQGRIELRREPVAVADLVARSLETVDPLIRRKRHQVSITASCAGLHVNVDPERLVQCLANLLTNAAKYTEPEGHIRVHTREDGGNVIVSVSDNGMGIAPELMPKIFDLFVQGERTLDRSQGGLGIGLSLVKRLVDMHGGDVQIMSSGERRGTTVEIRLPLLEGQLPAPQDSRDATGVSRRILVVDDNEDAANTLAMILKLEGHDVDTAYSGAEALGKLDGFRPGVVLLDIGLPGIDGFEVAARIRAQRRHADTRLVAITGYGQDADRARTLAAGFEHHLVKPVDFTELLKVLGSMSIH
jgi:signal transduction histidine kinase